MPYTHTHTQKCSFIHFILSLLIIIVKLQNYLSKKFMFLLYSYYFTTHILKSIIKFSYLHRKKNLIYNFYNFIKTLVSNYLICRKI